MLNSRHIAELIEKGDMDGIRESMDKSMTPGSQTFEQALFNLYKAGTITLDAATAAADSANNLLFLIHNDQSGTTQAPDSVSSAPDAANPLSMPSTSFSEFNLKMD